MSDDSSSWWSKKLGSPTQRTAAQPRQPAAVNGMDLYRQRHPEVFGDDVAPPVAPAEAVPFNGVVIGEDGVERVPAGLAIRSWQGREGAKELETLGRCPSCNSPRYFSRAQGILRGPPPSPLCEDCGYPLVQSGSGIGSLGGSASTGSQHAKQIKEPSHLTTPLSQRIIARVQ